jgi:hypothetical protein
VLNALVGNAEKYGGVVKSVLKNSTVMYIEGLAASGKDSKNVTNSREVSNHHKKTIRLPKKLTINS